MTTMSQFCLCSGQTASSVAKRALRSTSKRPVRFKPHKQLSDSVLGRINKFFFKETNKNKILPASLF